MLLTLKVEICYYIGQYFDLSSNTWISIPSSKTYVSTGGDTEHVMVITVPPTVPVPDKALLRVAEFGWRTGRRWPRPDGTRAGLLAQRHDLRGRCRRLVPRLLTGW